MKFKTLFLIAAFSISSIGAINAFANCDCEQDDSGNWVAIHEGDNQPVQYFSSSDQCFQWVDTADVCNDN